MYPLYMRLKPIKEYAPEEITGKTMRDAGIPRIQSQRQVNGTLTEFIRNHNSADWFTSKLICAIGFSFRFIEFFSFQRCFTGGREVAPSLTALSISGSIFS